MNLEERCLGIGGQLGKLKRRVGVHCLLADAVPSGDEEPVIVDRREEVGCVNEQDTNVSLAGRSLLDLPGPVFNLSEVFSSRSGSVSVLMRATGASKWRP